jgi:hypothetical protein
MTSLVVLVTLAHAGGGAHAGGEDLGKEDLGKIDGACAVAARAVPSNKSRLRVFAETSGAVLPKPRQGDWRELGDEAELKKLADGEPPPNTEATVRSTPAATVVSMYFQDKSGDWAHVVDYCYRPSGSLARLRGTFNSYAAAVAGRAGVRRRRTMHFDDTGVAFRTESRAFDLATDRPLGQVSFKDEADPIYLTLRALPFWASLAPPADVAALDPGGVVKTVREHLPAIKACYEHALKKTPAAAGKVVARWKIDDAGKVGAFAWQSDEMGSPPFSACARRVVESWRFAPARGEPVTVTFPFVFERADAKVTLSPVAAGEEPKAR